MTLQKKKNRLNFKDFIWADYPSDEKILKVRSEVYILVIFLNGMVKNAELSIKNYNWKVAKNLLKEHIEIIQI